MTDDRPLASCLASSLKVIATDTDRSTTYDSILVIHGPIWYCFQDKRQFRSKIAKYSDLWVVKLHAKWAPLEFCNGVVAQKMLLPQR